MIPDAISASFARMLDTISSQIFGISAFTTGLVIALGFSVFANILQFKRNNILVDQLLTIIPVATSKVLEAVSKFREVVRDLQKTKR
jgi:hypothetical protein